MPSRDLEPLIGKTMKVVRVGEVCGEEAVIFETVDGETFALYHESSCCESVTLEDVEGDFAALAGRPLVVAYESMSDDQPPRETCESHTWSFYHFATTKGSVSLRWLGESNGYYSECVELHQLDEQGRWERFISHGVGGWMRVRY